MKIAFIGQRGIPCQWGGVEAHVEDLAHQLTKRDHEVSVYSRNWYIPKGLTSYNGARLIRTPTINTKHLDASIHSFTSSIHALLSTVDIVHYQAIGPAFFSWMPKIRAKVVCTIHRYDYEADKWGGFAKSFLKLSERVALSVPDATIVIAKYQQDLYCSQKKEVFHIPYGVRIPEQVGPDEITAKYGLEGGDYVLFMGRLSPEKRVDWLIRAYNKLGARAQGLKLVIAGDSSATDKYVSMVKAEAGDNASIIFTGYVQGKMKEELFSNAKLFLIPSILEGLPIALLEAMSYGRACLASDIAPHKETIQEAQNGFLFDSNDESSLAEKIASVIGTDGLENVGEKAREYVKEVHDSATVAKKTEDIYQQLLNRRAI